MKITVLVENTSNRSDIKTEHGLSLHIETAEQNILFDMGQSSAFVQNADTLGIDLSNVDIAIVSHGHYDHGGGLPYFLRVNRKSNVYINKDAFLPHYNSEEKYIGLNQDIQDSNRIIFTDNKYIISEKLTLFTGNKNNRKHSFGDCGLTERVGALHIKDDFHHEQYLLIEDKNHRVLISGCSHKGIINIVDWFKPTVLIGGFHFFKLPLEKTLSDASKVLNRYDTEYYTCHCTGKEQFDFMKQHMSRLHYLSCGESVTI